MYKNLACILMIYHYQCFLNPKKNKLMISVDSNYMNMALATQTVLTNYPELLKDRQSLLKKITLMDTLIESIQKNQEEAEEGSGGTTVSKAKAGRFAIDMALDLAGRAYVFSDDSENEKRKKAFGLQKTYFTRPQDVIKVSRLKHLTEQLDAVAKESESYDVTPDDVVKLKEAIAAFETQLASPRGATVVRKTHNDNVKSHLSLLKKTFKSIDKLMTKLRGTELFKEYKLARKIIDLGTRKSQGRRKKKDDNVPTDLPDDKEAMEE